MSAGYLIRIGVFFTFAMMVGLFAIVSPAGAATAAVMAFGYGVAEICDALAARGETGAA